MCSFHEKVLFFVHMRKCNHTPNCTCKLSHTLSDGFTSNINFLISKQNKTPNIDPKMLKQ